MPGYVKSVDFAAWHIPCYSRHNCNGRSRFAGSNSNNAVMAGASLGTDLVTADSSSGAVSAFLLFLLLASLLGGVAVASSLISRKGYLRPLNVFILFVLASDWLLISTVFPMQVQ